MIAYLAALIALLGLLMFSLSANPKIVEIGKCLMYCGFFVMTWMLGQKTIKLF